MKHTIVYLGRLSNYDDLLKHGRVAGFRYRDVNGKQWDTETWVKGVDGLIFYYMEEKKSVAPDGNHGFYVVAVDDLVLANRVRLNPPRHTAGKMPGPKPAKFDSTSAGLLVNDIISHNPRLAETLQRLSGEKLADIIALSYTSGEASGWTDVIERARLKDGEVLTHDVRGPEGEHSQAKCLVHLVENTVYLDYVQHKKFNRERDMYIGMLRLVFTDSGLTQLVDVAWRDEGALDFEEEKVLSNIPIVNNLPSESAQLQESVDALLHLPLEELEKKLPPPGHRPRRKVVTTIAFERSPAVVAYVLQKAAGRCQRCGAAAPFNRMSDGTAYLEVHHKIRLADNGADSVDNAEALCPNCHRRRHFGPPDA